MNITRRRLATLLGGAGAALFAGPALVASWARAASIVKQQTVPVPLYKQSVTTSGKELYSADFVDVNDLDVKPIAEALKGRASLEFQRCELPRTADGHQQFSVSCGAVNPISWGNKPFMAVGFEAIRRAGEHCNYRLSDWYIVRWAMDREAGRPNHEGVNPRMLILIGEGYEERGG